jgi:hypothetical protein
MQSKTEFVRTTGRAAGGYLTLREEVNTEEKEHHAERLAIGDFGSNHRCQKSSAIPA